MGFLGRLVVLSVNRFLIDWLAGWLEHEHSSCICVFLCVYSFPFFLHCAFVDDDYAHECIRSFHSTKLAAASLTFFTLLTLQHEAPILSTPEKPPRKKTRH